MSDYIKRLAGPYVGQDYVGQKTFTFGFFTYKAEDIYVGTSMSIDEATTILEEGVDYTVTLNDDQEAVPGGFITLTDEEGLKDGEALVIGSALDPVKTIELTNYSRFPPEQIDTEFNRIFIILQQIYEETGRTLKVPATSTETPEDMIERLLAAQQTAQAAADVAVAAKDEALEILENVQRYGEAAEVLEPIADEIATVAGSIDAVNATGENITSVNIVAGDIDTTTQPVDIDYGDYDDNSGSGESEVPTGGNIVIVAQNIDAVKKVGQNMDSILAIEDKIDGLDQTVEEMEAAVTAAETAEAGAESSATQAGQSATQAAAQVTIAKDWAIKTNGKVQENGVEVDFSAKYWAQQAKGSADSATATLTQVTQAGETAVGNVQSAQTSAIQAVNSAGTTQVGAVEDAKDSAITAITNQQASSVSAVNAAGTQQTANAKAQADAAAQSASAASTAKTQAEAAKADAVTAKGQAETAASTATTKASEAAQSATDAGNAKTAAVNAQTAAEAAQAAAEAAQAAAEEVAGSLGDPLGKDEASATYLSKTDAASTYATKTEVTTGLSGKADTNHNHTIANVTGLQSALDSKQAAGDYATSTELTQGLAGKANSTHTHEISNVNGLQAALDGKQPSGSYAPATHTHTASQITDLGALGTKDEITAAELAATIDYGEYADA